MSLATMSLSQEQVDRLRAQHPYDTDLSWMVEIAREEGWLSVNRRYLHQERRLGELAMRSLLDELRIEEVTSASEAADIIDLALQVFTPPDGFSGTVERTAEHSLRVENENCPVFQRIVNEDWHGITACPSWHRRAGWYDAMHVRVTDSIVSERKWGDDACISTITVDEVMA